MGQRSFKKRILLAFTGTLLINTLFLISYIRISGEKFLYAQNEESVRNLVAVLEKAILPDLVSGDYGNLKSILDPVLLGGSSIEVYRIFDREGFPVAYGKAEGATDFLKPSFRMDMADEPSFGADPLPDKKHILLADRLLRQDEPAGAVLIQYSREILFDRAMHVIFRFLIYTFCVLLAGVFLFSLALRKISRPILEVSRQMMKYGEKDFRYSCTYDGDDEIGALNRSIKKMSEQVLLGFEMLRNSEERFELAVLGSHDGIWDYDPRGDLLYVSPRGRDILMCGYGRPMTLRQGISLVTVEDTDRLIRNIHALVSNRSTMIDTECRIRQKGKSPKWIRIKGKGVFSEEGKCLRIAGSLSDIDQQKSSEEKLIRAAMYDMLTGLPNRLFLMERLQQIMENKRRAPDRHFALLILDYDGFKKVNDTYGHAAGDAILRLISQRLKRCLRPQDLMSRVGGDEFVILLEDCGARDDVARIAQRLLDQSSREFLIDGSSIFLTVSIGIAMDDARSQGQDELLQFSDIAMYEAKKNGKGVYSFYREEMQSRIRRDWKIQNDIHNAVENRELFLVYQPIIDLEDNSVREAEILMRWKHPARGMISPADFIPSSEESGFITRLTDWLIEELRGMEEEAFYNNAGEKIRISLNLSAKDFINNPPILKRLQERFTYGSPLSSSLDVEVTETALIDNLETVSYQLSQLQAMGMKIKLDDFGTGYSSLSYLHHFPLDVLKIDRSFVSSLPQNITKRNIMGHIISLAHDLGLSVIAEGIENKTEHRILGELGCDMGQGFYYSLPLEIDGFRNYLSKQHSWALTG
jgi:diguanylate cyclase (GGDEF)-like protein/PAS domain S-box-containing protein